jgi:hypothetical protein
MAKFILIAYDAADFGGDITPDEMQAIIARYMAWTGDLAQRGKLVLGEKLADGGGKTVTKSGGSIAVADGPFTEAKEVIGGFWIVECADEAEAIAIAASCPHAEHARVGVQPIEAVG